MASLLVHSADLPLAARAALRAAQEGSGRRVELLESAARILQLEAGVACGDARELVDLEPGGC